tara:strand:- start:519 stop:632 length:114 start_codon:yes stop_codon:yes gene_type:complete
MLDGLHANGRGHWRFACPRATHQHDVLGIFQELTAVQ